MQRRPEDQNRHGQWHKREGRAQRAVTQYQLHALHGDEEETEIGEEEEGDPDRPGSEIGHC